MSAKEKKKEIRCQQEFIKRTLEQKKRLRKMGFQKGQHPSPQTEFKKGHIPWHKNTKGAYKLSEETKRKIIESRKWYKHSEGTRRKIGLALKEKYVGSKSSRWKGGIYINNKKKYQRDWKRERDHRLEIHKTYSFKYGGPKPQTEREKRLLRKYNLEKAGSLSIQTIQKVYENNIKEFGTLTCIYCFEPIPFGKDTLEHIIPISRGGTNEYKNLAISCSFCNTSKYDRTLEEWIKESFEE